MSSLFIDRIETVSKAATRVAPGVSVNPYHPPAYATWEESRKQLWDQIPFNANEYYLHYLPPGVSPRPSEWSDSEIAEFKTLITVRCSFAQSCRFILLMTNGVCFLSIFWVELELRYCLN